MNITFGIIVGPGYNSEYVTNLLNSILDQNIDRFEIIMIGQNIDEWKDYNKNIKVIPFDESQKAGWITRKKNIVAQNAMYENVCILHDNFLLHKGWYDGVKKCPDNWNILMNEILTLEGNRHVSWNVSPFFMQKLIETDRALYIPMLMNEAPHENGPQYINGLPYDVDDLSHIQYIGGGFIFCKRSVLLDVPLNEDMVYSQPPGEDVEWSLRLSEAGYTYRFNPYSQSSTQRPNRWHVYQMPSDFVSALRKYYGSRI